MDIDKVDIVEVYSPTRVTKTGEEYHLKPGAHGLEDGVGLHEGEGQDESM